jgi:hypothetical protein
MARKQATWQSFQITADKRLAPKIEEREREREREKERKNEIGIPP